LSLRPVDAQVIELPDDFRDLLVELEGRRVPVIGLEALLRNKRAANREQDVADVKALEAAARRRKA
jgi:hypothetical protein